ncbi:MAG: alanine racemase [Actinobacteria bacterium]|nr:alanine racemase [Actinomycetota bacterium]
MKPVSQPSAERFADGLVDLPAGLRTPCAVVDLPTLRENLAAARARTAIAGIRLRPHVKTHSSTALAGMQLEAVADGLTVGTLGMAERFAVAGFDDLLIASPLWVDAATAPRLRALHEGPRLTVGLDGPAAAQRLAAAVAGSRRPLRVLIEVDCGHHRSGVQPERAGDLAVAAAGQGLEVAGVFTYPGHAYASPAAPPRAAADQAAALRAAVASLAAAGHDSPVVSGGSTPTAPHPADGLTELRPGTYVFHDLQQVALGAASNADVALAVAATVVSTAVPGQLVLDAGAKALGRDRPEWLPGHGLLARYPELRVTRVFDYHAVVPVPEGAPAPSLGDVVAVIPNHVCTVAHLADQLILVEAGKVQARWPIDGR